jgi:hypothetical protein
LGNWQTAADKLNLVWTKQPHLGMKYADELGRILTEAAQARWNEKGDARSRCLWLVYSAGSDQPVNEIDADCGQGMLYATVPVSATTKCLAVDPQQLEYPGITHFYVSSNDCTSTSAERLQGDRLTVINQIGNSGFTLPGVSLPAAGVTRYYGDSRAYELASTIALDELTGRYYLRMAPQAGTRPDSLMIDRFPVDSNQDYLIGGVGRSSSGESVQVGCIWWGGASHGNASFLSIKEPEWTLHAEQVRPPAGADTCAFVVFNTSRDHFADLDSILFAAIPSNTTKGSQDAP